jgi:hypothetical protein
MYECAKKFPTPFNLMALAKALGVQPDDLAPNSMPQVAASPSQLTTEDKGGGMVLIRMNLVMPWSKALKILAIAQPDGAAD